MKVSIIITAYNVEDYIERAIESVQNQLFVGDLELIIVDDCSTDNTIVIADEAVRDYDWAKVIVNEHNEGAGMSRRLGVEQATGDYVLFLDADDYLGPDFINALANVAEETDADIVSGGVTVVYEDGSRVTTTYPSVVIEDPVKRVTKFWDERVQFMANKLIRRSLFESVPYCSRRFIEDTPTIVPLLYEAKSVAYTAGTSAYYYVQREGSLCHEATVFRFALYRALCYMDLLDYFGARKETEILERIGAARGLDAQLRILRNLQSSPQAIAESEMCKDWCEMTVRLLNRMKH